MHKSILIVDEDDIRRRKIASRMTVRGAPHLDVADAFAGMAALGRADFGAVLATEGRRSLSLRGLCSLARRRHPNIQIFILPRPDSDPEQIRAAVEQSVDVLSAGLGADGIVTSVLDRMSSALETTMPGLRTRNDAFPAPPPTGDTLDVFGDVRVSAPPARVSTLMTTPSPSQSSADLALDALDDLADLAVDAPAIPAPRPLLEGRFEESAPGIGPALLMGLFSQELTGRLIVTEGEASGLLYFHRGEPVWADDPAGDAGLYRRLIHKGLLPVDVILQPVPDGQLIGALVQSGRLSGEQMHSFMRDVVRERVIACATQANGDYRFEEDRSFLDVAPLFKVNPFGLVLESRRRMLPPPQLMGLSAELEALYMVPNPGLGGAEHKLAPFLRGRSAAELIDGTRRVSEFFAAVELDPFMGTLVVVTLRDTHLISMEDEPREVTFGLTRDALTESPGEIEIADSTTPPEAPVSDQEALARDELFSLYARLKPLSTPTDILGVPHEADRSLIESAYRQRLARLDPRFVPDGSARHLLMQRIEERRRKVERAYEAVTQPRR